MDLTLDKLICNLNAVEAPLPPLSVPSFKEGAYGDWRLIYHPKPKQVYQGYWSGKRHLKDLWVLKREDEVWMSTALMEIESQSISAIEATGNVLICGLGMGVLLYNICQKPDVNKIIVVERDPNVVEMLLNLTDCKTWKGWDKVQFEICDALTYKPRRKNIDYLVVDIWEGLGADQALTDTQTIQRNVKAKAVSFWGQEQVFIWWWLTRNPSKTKGKGKVAPIAQWYKFVRESGMPLKGSSIPDYSTWCHISLLQQARNKKII